MKKNLTRLLSVLLALVLTIGVLPVSALADGWRTADSLEREQSASMAESVETQAASNDDYLYNIMFLDCGRKYYSVDSIKQIIDNASSAGFNYIQLAIGNDGLRLLLDDMELTVNGTTYTSDAVSSAIHTGNEAYYNFDVDELTQSEMDTIIAYAAEKGMGVIPCVNTPGHMDAILSAATSLTGTNCSYNSSVRTIDVTNTTAVAFTKAVLQKYIDYFAGKGCKLFNMGADEYANDIYTSGSMGFGNLQSTGKYSYYVNYVNEVAKLIETAGMIPMAFNDGIYFNNNTSSGTFDTDIRICYWSNGWSGYTPMSASNLSAKGFRLINTNGYYYWVLGKPNDQCSATRASGFDANTFAGNSTINNPLGSMFCIWADYPGAETEASVISKTAATIAAFGAQVKDLVTDTTDPVAPVDPVDPTDPETVNVTLTVGQSRDYTQTGDVTEQVDTDGYEAEIAGYKTEYTQIEGSSKKVLGDKIDVSSGTSSTGVISDGNGNYLVVDSSGNISNTTDINAATEFTVTRSGRYYYSYTIYANSRYLYVNRSGSWRDYTYTLSTTTTSSSWYYETDSGFYDANYYRYLVYNSGWNISSSSNTPGFLYSVKTETTDPVDATKITFTGNAVGETKIKIGNVIYNITVTEEDISKVTPAQLEYWITNAIITTVPGTKTVTRTNTENKDYTVYYSEIPVTQDGVYSPDGIDISTVAPKTTEHDSRTIYYWHCRMLDTTLENKYGSKTGAQTNDGGDDETDGGVAFTKIRYYGGTWSVFTANNEWVPVDTSKHQLVAYYKEYLKVTDEVESFAADWGNKGDNTPGGWLDVNNYCTLSIQVVYEDGSMNPDGSTAADLTAKSFVYGYWADNNGRGIGTVILDGTDNYEIIKVTAETGASTVSFNTSNHYAATITNLTWDNNEKTVWENADGSNEAVVHNPSNNFSKDGVNENLCWDENKEAILLRVYVRAKITEDSLRVHYIDRTNGVNDEFYNYNIAVVSGTVFNESFKLNNGVLEGNTVTNIKNVTQTITTDLSKLTEVKAQYRYSKYTCVEATRSDDGKDVYLYYTFDNAVTYVVDFGLPVTIEPKDINANLSGNNVTLDSVDVDGASSGTTTVNAGYGFTYTPNADFTTSSGEKLTVTYHGSIPAADGKQEGDVSYQIYILPASNVLYEENFLTTASADWQEGTSSAPTAAQQTQKLDSSDTTTYNVFGTDAAYDDKIGEIGVWQAAGLSTSKMTGKLTTSFYGSAFDLIGNCGADTGCVVLFISRADGSAGKYLTVIDTRYTKDNLYQVPLAHVELKDEAAYNVEIVATGLAAKTVTPTNGSVAVMSAQPASVDNELLRSLAQSYGVSMADVEYVSVNDTVSSASVSAASDIAMFAAEPQAESISYAEGTHVEIDSFRVYRTADKSNAVAQNYPAAEQDITYWNILDVMKGQTITAYTENGDVTDYAVESYEAAGGPQNEIYLSSGQAISFKIEGVNSIQVSLRAVDKAASWATSKTGGNPATINTNTEMYYTVDAVDGVFTIANRGETLLAIGNAKLPSHVTADKITPASEIEEQVLLQSLRAAFGASSVDPEPELFQPSTFDAKVSSLRLIRNKLVTIRISVSSDVSYVTVNGVKYWPGRQLTSWQKTRYIQFHDTVGKYESKTYTIVAYDANGVASAPITVNG